MMELPDIDEGRKSEAESIMSGRTGRLDGMLFNVEVLDAVFAGLPMGVLVMDGYGVVHSYSHGVQRMFLYQSSEVIGENIRMLMDPVTASRHDYYLARARQKAESRVMNALDGRPLTLDELSMESEETIAMVAETVSKIKMFGGGKREVAGVDRNNNKFPAEITVAPVLVRGGLFFVGYLDDVRALTTFQDLTVKQELMLRSILDRRTLARHIKGDRSSFDSKESASIMFITFLELSKKVKILDLHQAGRFVKEINGLLDKVVLRTPGVEKVRSVGDTYVVCSGLHSDSAEHTQELLMLAMEAVRMVQIYNQRAGMGEKVDDLVHITRKGPRDDSGASLEGSLAFMGVNQSLEGVRQGLLPLHIAMAIHTGPLVGGVLTDERGIYDVVGSTMEFCSRLVESALTMRVTLSETAYNKLGEDFQESCEFRPKVNVRGHGLVNTYVA